MTEIETMQRAKMYVDKLANGINPITDQPVSEADCVNHVKVSRCLFYVSDILRRVIENGGNKKGKGRMGFYRSRVCFAQCYHLYWPCTMCK